MSMFVSMDRKSGTLSIQQIEVADAGDYICVAVNLAGTAQAKIRLDVGCKQTSELFCQLFGYLICITYVCKLWFSGADEFTASLAAVLGHSQLNQYACTHPYLTTGV